MEQDFMNMCQFYAGPFFPFLTDSPGVGHYLTHHLCLLFPSAPCVCLIPNNDFVWVYPYILHPVYLKVYQMRGIAG